MEGKDKTQEKRQEEKKKIKVGMKWVWYPEWKCEDCIVFEVVDIQKHSLNKKYPYFVIIKETGTDKYGSPYECKRNCPIITETNGEQIVNLSFRVDELFRHEEGAHESIETDKYGLRVDINAKEEPYYVCRALDCYDEENEHYTPSSTAGDYGPSNPWQAPGMSERDFF